MERGGCVCADRFWVGGLILGLGWDLGCFFWGLGCDRLGLWVDGLGFWNWGVVLGHGGLCGMDFGLVQAVFGFGQAGKIGRHTEMQAERQAGRQNWQAELNKTEIGHPNPITSKSNHEHNHEQEHTTHVTSTSKSRHTTQTTSMPRRLRAHYQQE